MKKLLYAATALALSATAAMSDTVTVPSGYWTAFRTKSDTSSKTICGMHTMDQKGGGIFVKYVEGDETLLVQIMKISWRFAAGRQIKLQLTIGFDGSSQSVNATGYMGSSGSPIVEFRIGSLRSQSLFTSRTTWRRSNDRGRASSNGTCRGCRNRYSVPAES